MANVTLDVVMLQLRQSRSIRRSTIATRRSSTAVPEMKNGYLYANETPGWGIEVDEKASGEISLTERVIAAVSGRT